MLPFANELGGKGSKRRGAPALMIYLTNAKQPAWVMCLAQKIIYLAGLRLEVPYLPRAFCEIEFVGECPTVRLLPDLTTNADNGQLSREQVLI